MNLIITFYIDKLDSNRDTANLQSLAPAVHSMHYIEKAQGDDEATKIPGCHSNNYDFLTYKRCSELTGNPEPLEGYDVLSNDGTCAITMGGNAAYGESNKTSRHGIKRNTGKGLEDEKTFEVSGASKSASMKSNRLYNTTMVSINQV